MCKRKVLVICGGTLRIYLVKVFLSVRFSPNVKNTCISNLRHKPNSDFHFWVGIGHRGIGVSHCSSWPIRSSPTIVIGKKCICDGLAKKSDNGAHRKQTGDHVQEQKYDAFYMFENYRHPLLY